MKKTLSMILAAIMTMSIGVTAFAQTPAVTVADIGFGHSEGETILVDHDNNTNTAPYTTLKPDSEWTMEMGITEAGGTVKVGSFTDAEEKVLESVKFNLKLTSGKDVVKESGIKKKNGQYLIYIKFNAYEGVELKELDGEGYLTKKSSGSKIDGKTETISNVYVGFDRTFTQAGEVELEIDNDKPVVVFDKNATNAVLSGDNFSYDVNLVKQEKVNLRYDNAANKAISIANEQADLQYLNFKGNSAFDFTGELVITVADYDSDKDYYFYEIGADNKLIKSKASFDEEKEGFVLKTMKLGSYVISDKELKAAPPASSGSSNGSTSGGNSGSASDADKNNPSMGMGNMVGVMATMAVVSAVAAAGVVALRKKSK